MCWNASTNQVTYDGGDLLSIPVNPNIPIMHYRRDLYEANGLSVPQTWDELYTNAEALNDQPAMYGISQHGQRGAFDVTYDVLPYLWSHGGSIFADQKSGDFTVTINSPETLAGMQTLETHCRAMVQSNNPLEAGIVRRVRLEIAELLPMQHATTSKVAVEMGFSPRSLQ